MVWHCHSFVDGLSYKFINAHIKRRVKLINHDCLPISMSLNIMLHIMLAYLMLFAALSNAVCKILYFLYFFSIDFCKCFFHALPWFIDTVCLFQ